MPVIPYCMQADYMAGAVQSLAATSIAAMALLLALAYMAAQFFRKQEYESFVSIEAHQLIVSAVLLISVFGAAHFACLSAAQIAGGDLFTLSADYLDWAAQQYAVKAVGSLHLVVLFTQYWGSMSFRWGAAAWGVAVPGFPSFIMIERVADFLVMLITPFGSSLLVQQAILETIRGVAIPFALPIGVVLRTFPPTRDAGAFMIASALGFAIIYPFTYVMHDNISRKLAVQFGGADAFDSILDNSEAYHDVSILGVLSPGLFDTKTLLFNPLQPIAFLMLQALFLPALSMIITVTFIKSMSKFISQKMG